MPIYSFKSPKSNKIIDIIQSMNDIHEYCDEDGVKWERIWEVPQASIDSQWDADSPADFISKSNSKKGNYGNLIDKSKELSEKREKKYGVDPQKEKYLKDWSKSRGGKKRHPEVLKREAKEIARKSGITIVD